MEKLLKKQGAHLSNLPDASSPSAPLRATGSTDPTINSSIGGATGSTVGGPVILTISQQSSDVCLCSYQSLLSEYLALKKEYADLTGLEYVQAARTAGPLSRYIHTYIHTSYSIINLCMFILNK